MKLKTPDDWSWEVVCSRYKENFILQKATGTKGQEGWIGIPNVELCTLTTLKEGAVAICDWDTKKELGIMGPNFRFHYSYIMKGYDGRTDYVGNPLPSNEEILATASKTHVRLKTVSEKSTFYCISDPKDVLIWDGYTEFLGNTPKILKLNPQYKFIALDDNLNINEKPVEKYRLHSLSVYDADITISGNPKGMYMITAPTGIYKHDANALPRYVKEELN
jgi:hypothetical protein